MVNQTVVRPGGQFPIPAHSAEQLLAFRCALAIRPYLGEDTQGAVLVDTLLTHTQIAGAVPLDANTRNLVDSASSSSSSSPSAAKPELRVTISVDGHTLTTSSVPFNASAHELSFALNSLTPRAQAYDVTCTGVSPSGQTFTSHAELRRLPDRTDGGSVVKLDGRTGALLVRNQTSPAGEWETIFPLGFYTSFSGYLDTNLSVLNDLADRG